MIFGIGTDLVEVERIRRVWERRGERFVARILCPEELPGFRRTKNPVRFLATRFAGKEAVVKAMGTGFSHGLWVRDVGIVADAWGKPCVIFSARGRAVCQRLGAGEAFGSLSDEAGVVLAFAVLLRTSVPA